MVIAQVVDGARIVRAQAAVSAILVTAFGHPVEGADRLVEALIGAGVALVFSQLVFSPDPLRLLHRVEGEVLTALAEGLQLTADGLERNEPALAEQALSRLRGLRDRLSDVDTMRKASGRIVRHSVTWRSKERLVVHERERAEQLDLLAGSCVLLTRTAIATPTDQRAALAPSVQQLAQAIGELAEQPGGRPTRQRTAERALELARPVIEHSESAPAQSALATACTAVRLISLDVMTFAGIEPAQAREALTATVRELTVADPPKPSPLWRSWRRHAPARRAGQERSG